MKTAIVVVAILSITTSAFSATIYVPDNYPTIQGAIDASLNGDTIIVRPGTYVENIDFIGKGIIVMSELGAEVTVIEGNQAGSVVTCKSGEGADSVLDGFTITNGKSSDGAGINCRLASSPTLTHNTINANSAGSRGGGIFCGDYSSPTLAYNTITKNSAIGGSGVFCEDSSPIIENNLITRNSAIVGGGISCERFSSPTITNNYITYNSAAGGGGIAIQVSSAPTLTNNTITRNSAWHGGGIYILDSFSPAIINNTITGNTANYSGGGIHCEHLSSPTITNNNIIGNSAADGGGISSKKYSSPTLTNNNISANSAHQGGGIFCQESSSPALTNDTITGNSAWHGGGILCENDSSPTVDNTIFWNNDAPQIWIQYYAQHPSSLTISYSDVQGGQSSVHIDPGGTLYWGDGMIDADPQFVDLADNDIHLTFNSPCHDTGDNSIVSDLYDFEGDPRIAWSGTVDMGADEFYTHLYCTGDATPGGKVEAKFVGLPGTFPVNLWLGSGILDPPLQTMFGPWYLEPPWTGPVILGSIPSPDGVLIFPARVHQEPPPPYDLLMQALIGLNSDSLTNLEVLKVR